MLNKILIFYYTILLRRKYHRTGRCLCCGWCCKKIHVHYRNGFIKTDEEFEELKAQHTFYSYLMIIDRDETGLVFSCSNLDEKTNLCTIHSIRPEICRRYPEEDILSIGGVILEKCGYSFTPIVPFSQVLKKEMKKLY